MTLNHGTTPLRAALMASALFLSSAGTVLAQDTAPAVMGQGVDITTLCGTKPTRVALIDGFGGDTWRRITLAELEDEAAKCPNITEVRYSEAAGDQQKYSSDINSFVAQGFDIIVGFTDFGEAALPAYRAAHQAGAVMVPYFSKLQGTDGTDFAANPYQDQVFVGGIWADWIGTNVKSGNVVLLGGAPGAASSQRFMDGFKEGLKKYPEITLLDENYIVTNWNPADAQKAVAGLIAQYPQIDAIASDYGVTTLAAVKAFEQAGLPVPAQATLASNNELNCKYLADKAAGKAFPYLTLDGTTSLVRFALRKGMAIHQGIALEEPAAIIPFPNADSFAGVDPKCDAGAPPDADLSSMLPADKLSALFKQ